MPIALFDPRATTPPGHWQTIVESAAIRGERFRLHHCLEFVSGMNAAFKEDRVYGIKLEREPDNLFDPHAIRALGFWLEPNGVENFRLIGYLDHEHAARISHTVGQATPLAGVLRRIETTSDQTAMPAELLTHPVLVVIDVLAAAFGSEAI